MGNDAEIGPNTPLLLKDAVSIAFPAGGMTVSGLRKERDRGRLCVEKIAGREFTTLGNIEQMRKQCRDIRRAQGSGSNQKNVVRTEKSSGTPLGSSETDRASSARAALEMTALALSKHSQNTSPQNTKSLASTVVTPLKSSS
jgi:hypothetical protein